MSQKTASLPNASFTIDRRNRYRPSDLGHFLKAQARRRGGTAYVHHYPSFFRRGEVFGSTKFDVRLPETSPLHSHKLIEMIITGGATDPYLLECEPSWYQLRSLLLNEKSIGVPGESTCGGEAQATFEREQSGGGWSPCCFSELEETFERDSIEKITALVLRIKGHRTEQIMEALSECEFFAYTTYWHTADNPSWIVAMPLNKPISPAMHGPLFDRVNAMFGGTLDKALNEDFAQLFDLPRVPINKRHFYYLQNTAEWLDAAVLGELDRVAEVAA